MPASTYNVNRVKYSGRTLRLQVLRVLVPSKIRQETGESISWLSNVRVELAAQCAIEHTAGTTISPRACGALACDLSRTAPTHS